MSSWVGIDLGSSSSCVSISRNNEIEVIADEQGSRTTPSYVAFTATDIIVGEAAVSQAPANLKNTIFDIKVLIGKKFSELDRDAVAKLPYKVVANENDDAAVEVTFKGKTQIFNVDDLVGFILAKMKKTAENYLGVQVENAVVSVPHGFTAAQRDVVTKAATKAKFQQSSVISDCSAVAMAYDMDVSDTTKPLKNVVVVDFGGRFLDVTALRVDQGVFTVLQTVSDASVGGYVVDDQLVEHFTKEFERKNKGVQLQGGAGDRALRKLRTASEKAKRVLTTGPQGKIELDAFHDGLDFFTNISRARFEAMTNSLARSSITSLASVLEKAGISKESVDHVLCVGGSTKLTKFRQALNDFFGPGKIMDTVSPDEAVVIGAALEASVLARVAKGNNEDPNTIQASSVTVGVEVTSGLMFPLIQRGAVLPASATRSFSTSEDNQTSVSVQLYMGDRVRVSDNQQLATFVVSGIPSQKAGQTSIDVTVEMSASGSLHVHAKAGATSAELEVTQTTDVPSQETLQKEVDEATSNAAVDKQHFLEAQEQANLKKNVATADSEDDEDDEGDEETDEESDDDVLLDDDLDD